MSLRPAAGDRHRWRWHRRRHWWLAGGGIVVVAVVFGSVSAGLSIGFRDSGETAVGRPSPSIGAGALEVHPTPVAARIQSPAVVQPTETPSPAPEAAVLAAAVGRSPSPPLAATPGSPSLLEPVPSPSPASTAVSLPPPLPAPPTSVGETAEAAPESGDLEPAQLLLALVNAERRKAGLGELAPDALLMAAAQAHAEAMAAAGVMAHQLGNGPTLEARVVSTGYVGWSALAEAVARGGTAPEQVLPYWLASPAHRANLLGASFSEAGVGHFFSRETGHFWVLVLAAR